VPIRLTATMNVPLAIPLAEDDRLHRARVKAGVVGLRADGGRVDEDVGAGEGVGPGQLGEPLVPAGGEAELGTVDRSGRATSSAGPGSK